MVQCQGLITRSRPRLIDPNGRPSVKIGASTTGAGLSFVGGADASHIIPEADRAETRLKMVAQGASRTVWHFIDLSSG